MIAILGTFASSSELGFKGLVDKYKDLPADVLSTAPASYAFVKDTPGPRYLVLTAYRIDVLQHICFVYLLQNIHEVIWSISPADNGGPHHYPIKQSRTGVHFQAATWWAPSWVEKMRIVRAYWNLFVYWNIQSISPDLTVTGDDWRFSIYRTALKAVDPCIGPIYDKTHDSIVHGFYVPHDIEEMKCVLTTTRDLLGVPFDSTSPFCPFTARRCESSNLHLEKWTFSTIFQDISQLKIEESRPVDSARGRQAGQSGTHISEINFHLRETYWHYLYLGFYLVSFEQDQLLLPPDYLGLCIWDLKRLRYLGLIYTHENSIDPCLGPVRNPTNNFFSLDLFKIRWKDVFLQELLKFPGGKSRPLSKSLKNLKAKWYEAAPFLLGGQ